MTTTIRKQRILFVCTGNICRSPTADGVARALAKRHGLDDRFEFDSAGTHGYHVGEAPDPRTITAARQRGYDLSFLRARRLTATDFSTFDLLLAMDAGHLAILRESCPPVLQGKLALFLDYSQRYAGQDVPDPYYGDAKGFDRVLDVVEETLREMLPLDSMT